MKLRVRQSAVLVALATAIGVLLPGLPRVGISSGAIMATGAQATPTPYHEGQPSPEASPMAMSTLYPMPSAEDLSSANSMTAGGAAMIQASELMAAAAETMIASGDPELAERGRHWQQDARALAERGAWMVVAATADSMVHDPAKAHELNLENLRGNGMSMAAEGEAMAQHGEEMLAEVAQLRARGALPAATLDGLDASARAMIGAGEALRRDGQRMQDEAEALLRSLGK